MSPSPLDLASIGTAVRRGLGHSMRDLRAHRIHQLRHLVRRNLAGRDVLQETIDR